ncbi:DUF3761 domain-containing protein [Streptomyces rimosus]|uniref:DUF3761 domain-containing protein n=1 Tax=Streptomyces rimosus TaxID=1927 RepID=UPI00099DD78A|nr:DUF3761 domain-containing protein [Streptomyces rimosus]
MNLVDGDQGTSSKPKATAPTETSSTLPDLTGETLAAARDKASALGISTAESRDLSGLNRPQHLEGNWKVCSTRPEAGADIDGVAVLTFDVVEVGEECLPAVGGTPGESSTSADPTEPAAEPTVDTTDDSASVSTASGSSSDGGSTTGGSSDGGSNSGSDDNASSSSSGSGGTSHPAGASALCNDGTYSYSQHRRGTCSHHHGVATWLR